MAAVRVSATIHLEVTEYKKLQRIAAKEIRTENNLMEYIVKKFLQEYQEKP